MLLRVMTPVTRMRLPSSISVSRAFPRLGATLLVGQGLQHRLGGAMMADRGRVEAVLSDVRGIGHAWVLGEGETQDLVRLGLLADGLVHAVDSLHHALASARPEVGKLARVGVGGGDQRGVGQPAAKSLE